MQQISTWEEKDLSIAVKGVKLLKIIISVNITGSFLQFQCPQLLGFLSLKALVNTSVGRANFRTPEREGDAFELGPGKC